MARVREAGGDWDGAIDLLDQAASRYRHGFFPDAGHRGNAILGAANYLHANGAPRDYRAALYHYNPSALYVDAVLAYADRIRRDSRNFFSYYAWQVFVRTPAGTRRITGPGRP